MHQNQVVLTEILERGARWHGCNDAAVDAAHRLDYRALREQAGRCAALLHHHGVRRGDRVALLMHPSAMHVVALFGAIELGAIPAALHVRESLATLTRVIERLAPAALVFDVSLGGLAAQLADGFTRPPVLVEAGCGLPADPAAPAAAERLPEGLAAYPMLETGPRLREDDPAMIVLSSGTTSIPKGVVHTHRSLMEVARGGQYLWRGIAPSDRVLNASSVSFIGWAALTLPFLNVGATAVFQSMWDAAECLRLLERERITNLLLVPTVWRLLLGEDVEAHALAVRKAGSAGEPLDERTLVGIRERICASMVVAYGSTETGAGSGTCLWEDELDGGALGNVGRPLLNSDVRIVVPDGAPDEELSAGEVGEVLISGPALAREIHDDPVRTAAAFVSDDRQRWWRSRDLGRLDADGRLVLEGRVDDMIISGGINVFPAVVENVLMAHPGVRGCAVVGAPDDQWGQRVCAYVVADDGVDADQLDAHARDSELAGYQRPRGYVFVDELPRTTTGKVDRRDLRARAIAEARQRDEVADA
jgi:long-chain acyl-CoA synthetase